MSASFSEPRRTLPRRFVRWVRSVLFYEHWMIGIVDRPISEAVQWTEMPPVHWIAPFDRARYLADPFPWPGSADTLMCEAYDMRSGLGRIDAIKLDEEDEIAVDIAVDLPLPGHLSFPFLFMRDGVVYALPESGAARRLEILRWEERQGVWVSHASVFDDMPAADAIFFEKDGLLWIAYTDATDDPHDNLNLVYARDVAGPWRAHPQNPVRRGRAVSRNGGGVFAVDGKLYRPAQDCSEIYGGAIALMEIVTCSESVYEEKQVTHIRPSSRLYPRGFHTLTAWGDRCLVDGMRLVFSPRLLAGKVARRVKRLVSRNGS